MTDKNTSIGVIIDASGAESGARRAESAMQGVGSAATQMAGQVETSGRSFASFGNLAKFAAGALAGFSVMQVGKSLLDASMQAQKAQVALSLVTGTTQAAAIELEGLRARADQLGVSFTAIMPTYTSFMAATKGTAIEGDAARKVFDSVSKAVSVLHLSADQTTGVFTALQQMVSKGTVSAEELRGQLGERLPGAFNLAAAAMGVTTAQLGKMLENGEIAASDLLPKLAMQLDKTFDPKLADSADTLQSNINRLNNEFFALKEAVANSGLADFANEAVKLGTDVLVLLKDAVTGAGDAAIYMSDGITAITVAAGAFLAVQLPGFLISVATALGTVTAAQIRLNLAMLANPFGILALAIAAPIVALNAVRNQIEKVTGNFLTLWETAQIILNKIGSWLGVVKDKGDLTTQSLAAVNKRAQELADKKGIPFADALEVVRGKTTLAALAAADHAGKIGKGEAAAVSLGKNGTPGVQKITKAMQEAARQAQQFAEYISALEADTASKQALMKGDKLTAEKVTEQNKLERQLNRKLTVAEIELLNDKLKTNQKITDELKAQEKAQEEAKRAAEKALKDTEDAAKKAAEAAQKPFIDAAERIQSSFADMFTNIFEGGTNSFKDFAASIKQTFARMLGELATLAIKNQVIVPIITAVTGAVGMPSTGNALGQALGGGNAGGGFSLSNLSSMSNMFGSGNMLNGAFGAMTGGATLNGSLSGFLTQFGATRGAGEFLAMNGMGGASLGAIGGAATLGYMGGGMIAGWTGGNQTGGSIGGALSATAGMVIGGPIGAAIGGALGGAIGGLFGGKKGDKFAGQYINLEDASVYGGYSKSGVNVPNRDALTNAALIARKSLMDVTGGSFAAGTNAQIHVGSRDGIMVSAGGQSSRYGVGDFEGAISGLTSLMAKRLTGIPADLQAAINNIDFSSLEDGFNDLQFAANLINGKLFDTTPVNQYKAGLDALNAQFDTYTEKAKALGIASSYVDKERAEALESYKKAALSPISSFLTSLQTTRGGLATPAEQLANQQSTFNDLVAKAKTMDLDAINALPQAGATLIQLQQAFSASGQATVDTIANVQAALQDILGTAGVSLTGNATVDAINNTSGSVVSAIQQLTDVQKAQSEKISALTAQIETLLNIGGNR